jgi:hypothetical protein
MTMQRQRENAAREREEDKRQLQLEMRRREQELLNKIKEQQKALETMKQEKLKVTKNSKLSFNFASARRDLQIEITKLVICRGICKET